MSCSYLCLIYFPVVTSGPAVRPHTHLKRGGFEQGVFEQYGQAFSICFRRLFRVGYQAFSKLFGFEDGRRTT